MTTFTSVETTVEAGSLSEDGGARADAEWRLLQAQYRLVQQETQVRMNQVAPIVGKLNAAPRGRK
jgi:hypothetical protein